MNITAKKTWSGDSDEVRPESVTVQLLKNGDEEDTQTLNADDWSYTWEKLPKYDCTWPTSYSDTGSRTEISYSVAETAAAGTTKTTDGKYILYNKNVSVKDRSVVRRSIHNLEHNLFVFCGNIFQRGYSIFHSHLNLRILTGRNSRVSCCFLYVHTGQQCQKYQNHECECKVSCVTHFEISFQFYF